MLTLFFLLLITSLTVERGTPPFLKSEYCDKSLSFNNLSTLIAIACDSFILISPSFSSIFRIIIFKQNYLVRHSGRFENLVINDILKIIRYAGLGEDMFKFLTKKKVNCEEILKICFTGHRPNGLPWKYNEKSESCVYFKKVMYSILEKAILNNYTYFISGMALGVDMICAEIVLELKKKYKNVFLECAIPCKNQSSKWSLEQQKRYNLILKKQVIFIMFQKTIIMMVA